MRIQLQLYRPIAVYTLQSKYRPLYEPRIHKHVRGYAEHTTDIKTIRFHFYNCRIL